MELYHVRCQDELALVIHHAAGVPEELAGEFAARASCGETVRFSVQAEVIGYLEDGRSYSLTESTTTWQARADETWELRKVEV